VRERTIDIYGLLANLFSRVIVQNNAAAAAALQYKAAFYTKAFYYRNVGQS
jgi:hypothetical protein